MAQDSGGKFKQRMGRLGSYTTILRTGWHQGAGIPDRHQCPTAWRLASQQLSSQQLHLAID